MEKAEMGHPLYIPLSVANIDNPQKHKVFHQALVDTGSMYSGITADDARELGLVTIATTPMITADGRVVESRIARANVTTGGKTYKNAISIDAFTPLVGWSDLEVRGMMPEIQAEMSSKHKPKLPVCTKAKAVKLEHCILSVKERNVDKGCKPEGTGSKKCPLVRAVCQSSLKCKVGVN